MIKLDANALKEALTVIRESVGTDDDEHCYVLIEALEPKSICLYSTSLLTFSKVSVQAFSKKKTSFLVAFSELQQYVNLWDGMLNLSLNRDHVIISCGKDKVKLPTFQGSRGFKKKFPKMNASASQQIAVGDFPYMVSTAHRIVDQRATMDALKGIHVMIDNKKCMVEATDGLHYISMNEPISQSHKRVSAMNVIINADSAKVFFGLSQESGFLWEREGLLFYECSDGVFAARLLSASDYPDLRTVSQSLKKKAKVSMSKKDVDRLIKKVSFTHTNRMTLTAGRDTIKAEAKGIEAGESVEFEGRVSAQIKGSFPNGIIVDSTHIGFLASLVVGKMFLFFGGPSDFVWYRDSKLDYATLPFDKGGNDEV